MEKGKLNTKINNLLFLCSELLCIKQLLDLLNVQMSVTIFPS